MGENSALTPQSPAKHRKCSSFDCCVIFNDIFNVACLCVAAVQNPFKSFISQSAVNLIQLLNGLFLYIICVVCLCIYEIVHRINLSLFVAWKRRGNWLTPYRFLQKVIQFIGDAIWSGCIRRACGHWTVSANDSVNISCSIFELKQQQQQKNGKKNKLWKCVTQYFRANGKKNHRK